MPTTPLGSKLAMQRDGDDNCSHRLIIKQHSNNRLKQEVNSSGEQVKLAELFVLCMVDNIKPRTKLKKKNNKMERKWTEFVMGYLLYV